MARAACKFIVHFSMSFCTTRPTIPSFQKNGTLLSCRRSHSRLRHFLDDFGECRFGRLLLCFPLTHTPKISRVRRVYRSILIKQIAFWRVMVATGWLPPSPLSGLLTVSQSSEVLPS